jgi:hypothetical protein
MPSVAQLQVKKVEIDTNCGMPCWFGIAVTIEGSRAAVGSTGQRTVYLYELGAGGWSEASSIQSSPFSFGSSLAFSGDWLVVGAPGDAPQGQFDAGSVHVYKHVQGTWLLTQILTASDTTAGATFGSEVAFGNGQLLVSAPRHSTGPSGQYRAGAVYVFDLTGSTWVEGQTLFAPAGSKEAYFGSSIGIDGRTLMISEPRYTSGVSSVPGAVHVFGLSATGWVFLQALHGSLGGPGDQFGGARAISIDGETTMIGSLADMSMIDLTGVVYVFQSTSSGWKEIDVLTPLDPRPYTRFGRSVVLRGNDAVIGSRADGDLGPGSGSAYHFSRSSDGWKQVGKMLATDGEAGDDLAFFGIGYDGQFALVGAPGESGSVVGDADGAAYFFELSSNATQYCSCAFSAPCGNHDDHGGCKNVGASGGVMAAAGSGSKAIDDLRFEARWLPRFVLGLTFMGSSAQQIPFGDGQLCVGPGSTGLFRFAAQDSGTDGVIKLGPGIVAYTHANFLPAGQIQAGDTWYFQTWYRDPAGPCGTDFNLTNGLKVEFTQ